MMLTIYCMKIKPGWWHGSHLWDTACLSVVDIIKKFQPKILRSISGVISYNRKENADNNVSVPLVKDEIQELK